jgi:hypothetical protein|tara:strand:+ start:6801 stop:7262 length:462 start_codon:yes stop_codon:yes gene_type:complete
MSVTKFDLTEDHIVLVRQLNFILNEAKPLSKREKKAIEITKTKIEVEEVEEVTAPEIMVDALAPFGSLDENFYQEIALIVGIPCIEGTELEWGGKQYDADAKTAMDTLYRALPTALEIILATGKFEAGAYKTKHPLRDWKLVKLFCETVKIEA